MIRKKILFLTGSPNQTTQMHNVASYLTNDYDCYFSQIFDDTPAVKALMKTGLIEGTVISDKFIKKSEKYYSEHGLRSDYRGETLGNKYDLVVMCSDMIFPKKFKNVKTVFVQEGMTDPVTLWSKVVKFMGLPGYYAMSTALNGSLNHCDVYCVASEGYKQKFSKAGTEENKIVVTGMPNFDNMRSYLNNDFPYKNYVLVATSDIRELYGFDNRKEFIKNCADIAGERQLIFKTHPNERQKRAVREIKKYAPADTLIYTDGNTNHMVANCDVLITQYSTVSYIGLALNKEVHSYFDIKELMKLLPLQNNGMSAQNIANVCQGYIEFEGNGTEYLKSNSNKFYNTTQLAWAG
jgi:hypothetical protein